MKLNNQQQEIVQILKQRGTSGMNSYEWRMRFIQLPVRIKELKSMGYLITTEKKKNRSVNYILIEEPKTLLEPRPEITPIRNRQMKVEFIGNVARVSYL